MCKLVLFMAIFIIGELIFNWTWFKYLKCYFKFEEKVEGIVQEKSKKFLFLDLSTFKGVMERFIISIGLILGFTPILIVFGTIKLGTRFKDNQDIKNDYFLIGNFTSILISISYYFVLRELVQFYNIT